MDFLLIGGPGALAADLLLTNIGVNHTVITDSNLHHMCHVSLELSRVLHFVLENTFRLFSTRSRVSLDPESCPLLTKVVGNNPYINTGNISGLA